MKSFYTNVLVYGSKILYRGIDNGRKVRLKADYHPTLFVPSQKPTEFTTVTGNYVSEINPGTIRDCRDFVKQYEDVDNFKVYGMQRYEYCFISDRFPDDIEWDKDLINVCNIDIEVGSENGFPEPGQASEPVTAITYKMGTKFVAFGCGDFVNTSDNIRYVKCRDEIDLLKRFVDEWSGDYPDIITGWNVRMFDIPYLVNRITRLLGEEMVKRLSPWNIVNAREVTTFGRTFKIYEVLGISTIDFLEIYRKYSPGGNSQESYRLDNIAHVELNERKMSYEEYGNLHTLYKDNYQKFIEYNIRDVELVEKLEDKLKLIELALTLSYDNKCNYDDVFTQVRMWDVIIYNHLRKKNMVIPPNEKHSKNAAYIGAYVKDPLNGMHRWVASFDLNSLYPHLIMQYNISPETLLEPSDYDNVHHNLISSGISIDRLLEKTLDTSMLKNHTVTPNGQFFDIRKQGFLPELMEAMYDGRSIYKKKAIEAKKELEKEKDPDKRYEIEKSIAKYNNLQLAKKVSLNSAYGALGNEFFRFFDIRQASAITTAGQLSIRWIEKKLNDYMNKILKSKDEDYVIASDTDSIYLSLSQLVNKAYLESNASASQTEVIAFMDKVCENKVQPFIDKSYDELARYVNAYAQKMMMKREALSDKGIWTAKKRYILRVHNNEGVQYTKPKLKVMGLEMIKSSTPSACREKLWQAVDLIFNGVEKDVIEFIENFRKEFHNSDPAEIAFPRGVNGLEKYKGIGNRIYGDKTPIHVRGSLIFNHHIRKNKLDKKYELIKEGEKIKFIYLKEPNTIQSDVISFSNLLPEELDIIKYIDYDLQFNKSFVEPLKIILDCIGWKSEHVSSLAEFFS
jgi:DNA polymerase elongation subunit (family B)